MDLLPGQREVLTVLAIPLAADVFSGLIPRTKGWRPTSLTRVKSEIGPPLSILLRADRAQAQLRTWEASFSRFSSPLLSTKRFHLVTFSHVEWAPMQALRGHIYSPRPPKGTRDLLCVVNKFTYQSVDLLYFLTCKYEKDENILM